MLSCVSVASRSLLFCPFVWSSPILFICSPAQRYLAVPRFWLLWIKLSWASLSKSCVWVFLLKALGHGDVCLKRNCQTDFQSDCTLHSPSGSIWVSGYPTSSPTLGFVRLFSSLVGISAVSGIYLHFLDNWCWALFSDMLCLFLCFEDILWFQILILHRLGVVFFVFILLGIHWAFWICIVTLFN